MLMVIVWIVVVDLFKMVIFILLGRVLSGMLSSVI